MQRYSSLLRPAAQGFLPRAAKITALLILLILAQAKANGVAADIYNGGFPAHGAAGAEGAGVLIAMEDAAGAVPPGITEGEAEGHAEGDTEGEEEGLAVPPVRLWLPVRLVLSPS